MSVPQYALHTEIVYACRAIPCSGLAKTRTDRLWTCVFQILYVTWRNGKVLYRRKVYYSILGLYLYVEICPFANNRGK